MSLPQLLTMSLQSAALPTLHFSVLSLYRAVRPCQFVFQRKHMCRNPHMLVSILCPWIRFLAYASKYIDAPKTFSSSRCFGDYLVNMLISMCMLICHPHKQDKSVVTLKYYSHTRAIQKVCVGGSRRHKFSRYNVLARTTCLCATLIHCLNRRATGYELVSVSCNRSGFLS
jgi:hypothetical protein